VLYAFIAIAVPSVCSSVTMSEALVTIVMHAKTVQGLQICFYHTTHRYLRIVVVTSMTLWYCILNLVVERFRTSHDLNARKGAIRLDLWLGTIASYY